MNRRFANAWFVAALMGLGCGDSGETGDDGPSECVAGEFCPGNLVCVDGFCVEPGGSTNNSMDETTMGNSTTDDPTSDDATTDEPTGDGDGEPGDGDGEPGDGDGEPGDGDGEPGDGDGDGGDGDGDPGMMCTTYNPEMCDPPGMVVNPGHGDFCSCVCSDDSDCPAGPVGTISTCALFIESDYYCGLFCDAFEEDSCPPPLTCQWLADGSEPTLGLCSQM